MIIVAMTYSYDYSDYINELWLFMCACMCACMHVCMYVWMHVCMHASMRACAHGVRMYVHVICVLRRMPHAHACSYNIRTGNRLYTHLSMLVGAYYWRTNHGTTILYTTTATQSGWCTETFVSILAHFVSTQYVLCVRTYART